MLTVLLGEISPGTKGSLLLTCKPGGRVCVHSSGNRLDLCTILLAFPTEIVALV